MGNQQLRSAISDAGLEVDQLADAVRVDAKTVERWLAGRVPYPRYRTRVAKVLHVSERDLWPDSQPQLKAVTADHGPEVVGYATATDPQAPDWQALMIAAQERIELMGDTLIDLMSVPGIPELLATKGAAGCQVRILISQFDDGWVARDDEDPDYDINVGAPAVVALNHARRHLAPLIDQLGVEIRTFPPPTWPVPMLRFDNEILYSPSLLDTPRTEPPLLHIHRRPGGLFDRLTDDFDVLWNEVAIRVYPGWYDGREDREDQDDPL